MKINNTDLNNAILDSLLASYLLQMYAVKDNNETAFKTATRINFTNYSRLRDITDEENTQHIVGMIIKFGEAIVPTTAEEDRRCIEWIEKYRQTVLSSEDLVTKNVKLKSSYMEILEFMEGKRINVT